MAPRKTRQKIKDHFDAAINHIIAASEQLSTCMELGEERSGPCFHLIPADITLILEIRDMLKAHREQL